MKITLIFSRHKEGGNCTASHLLEIIELVKPDVIFEELSEQLYKEAYTTKTLNNLESVAIRQYVSQYPIPHIPIDTFEKPINYETDQRKLENAVSSQASYESAQLRGFFDQILSIGDTYGFHYLNDTANNKNMEYLANLKLAVLDKLNDPQLHELHRKNQEVILKREDEMLDNVYHYATKISFSNGLMLIGSGHHESILRKIKKRKEKEELDISWQFYQDLLAQATSK